MRRKTIKLLFNITLIGLAFFVSACNLTSAIATPDANATQLSLISTQLAASPLFTPTQSASPTPSITPSPTPQFTPTYALPTAGTKPPSYTLQPGEFPYCIARRFDVDPKELLTVNFLNSGLMFSPGKVLTIPQSGRTFPTLRALHPHPVSFTVPESQMTVYKVACYFGDVDPAILMQYNRLTSPILTFGQVLQIY
jgi:LysM repeat protein